MLKYSTFQTNTSEKSLYLSMKKPFIGRTRQLIDKIQSLDGKWFVEYWEIKIYFIGIEAYCYKKEKVVRVNGKNTE